MPKAATQAPSRKPQTPGPKVYGPRSRVQERVSGPLKGLQYFSAANNNTMCDQLSLPKQLITSVVVGLTSYYNLNTTNYSILGRTTTRHTVRQRTTAYHVILRRAVILRHSIMHYVRRLRRTTTDYDVVQRTKTYDDTTYYDVLRHTTACYDVVRHTAQYYYILPRTMAYYNVL